ncbi:Hypothetical_protein [Hexamita inflata]|uniref:Hypothetical_protein n=1 Tax=Hexamita inflata TaxID=28002 RepID=A0AA86UFA6_9EUKA|nr:Hypothetical protein HINF_LOCUS41264 [Hexamita inflata]
MYFQFKYKTIFVQDGRSIVNQQQNDKLSSIQNRAVTNSDFKMKFVGSFKRRRLREAAFTSLAGWCCLQWMVVLLVNYNEYKLCSVDSAKIPLKYCKLMVLHFQLYVDFVQLIFSVQKPWVTVQFLLFDLLKSKLLFNIITHYTFYITFLNDVSVLPPTLTQPTLQQFSTPFLLIFPCPNIQLQMCQIFNFTPLFK